MRIRSPVLALTLASGGAGDTIEINAAFECITKIGRIHIIIGH